MIINGTAWTFGDGISATDIVSSRHDKAGMSRDWAECRRHLLEEIAPDFSERVQAGDVVIAGHHLGRGHAHYYTAAVMALKEAGIAVVLCESVNALFQRAAIDQGFLIHAAPGVGSLAHTGEQVEIDLHSGRTFNRSTGNEGCIAPVAPLLLDIVGAGSSLDWAVERASARS